MVFSERRRTENVQLREKINHIQRTSRKLENLSRQIQMRTVAMARQGQLIDLPCEKLAHDMSAVFQEQRATIALIQQHIAGTPVRKISHASWITDEELTALMK